MPSPIGHALAGAAVHLLASRDRAQAQSPVRLAWTMAGALLPDLDLTFRFFDGVNHHQAQMHSVGCALLAAAVAAVFWRLRYRNGWLRLATAVGAAWISHVVLDWLALDTHPPIGLMALWPLDSGYWKSPWPLFLDIGRTLEWSTIRHDLLAVSWEVAVLVPPLVLMALLRWRKWRKPEGSAPV